MANIDKDALLAAMRNSTQSPIAAEQTIARLEAGEFDIPEEPKKKKADAGDGK